MRKTAKAILLGLPTALAALAGYVALRLKLSVPRTEGSLSLPCLDDEVEVIFDRAGIPHITAASDLDAFRALGYVMAQDRMVQMQTMLRLATGTLAEAIGTMGVDMDRFMRTIGLSRIAEEFSRNMDPQSREALAAYCDGVNAYVAGPTSRLPFEFMFLKGRPRKWTHGDCLTLGLLTTWLLDSFWLADLMREKLIRSLGRERALELLPETAPYNNPPVKVDGPGRSAGVLDPGEDIDWGFDEEPAGGHWISATGGLITRATLGSNNWAIDGKHTTTGKPILCGDPHIQHNAPGMLYLCHVTTPEMDIIGAGFPGLPVIPYGHNGYCGWTATSLCPDTQDLYVETFESEESTRYLFEGEWREADVIEEDVVVRFGKNRRLRILQTVHGPVIRRKGNKGLALRWVSQDTSLDSLDAMLRQNRARSWDEFVSSMENFVGPAVSQVYADVDGNIGYMAAVKVPRRARGDGSVPCDGQSGDYEWEGYVPFADMPRAVNPEEGFITTANSKIVSEGYPELITTAWEAPYRNGRISELLRTRELWSPDDMPMIHADTFTFPGKTFATFAVRAAASIGEDKLSPAAREAIGRLAEWDFMARADSPAMTIYYYSWHHLREDLLRHRLGSTLYAEYTTSWTTCNLALENIIDSLDTFWLPPGRESFEEAVLESLEKGLVDIECVYETSDQAAWKWGRVHYLTCQNLLGLFWPLDKIFNVGPVPRDGEGDTVNASPSCSDNLTQLLARGTMGGCTDMALLPDCSSHAAYAGPVLRMIIDFSDFDNSKAVLDVGQSGHRLSPHYKDHFPVWCDVEYLPLPYSRGKVLEQAASTLKFLP
ncbi:MAG: penicillin acylase family protein [Candidatus Geothermincolia bacterium]